MTQGKRHKLATLADTAATRELLGIVAYFSRRRRVGLLCRAKVVHKSSRESVIWSVMLIINRSGLSRMGMS